MTFAEMKDLPGSTLVQRGVTDLDAGRESVEALLVSIGAPRLRSLGVELPSPIEPEAVYGAESGPIERITSKELG